MMAEQTQLHANLGRLQQQLLLVGTISAGVSIAGAMFFPDQFYQSYLFGYIFWIGITLGCLGILMLHHLVSGSWGFVIQRITEAGTKTSTLMAVLFLPLLVGLTHIYHWSRPGGVMGGEIMRFKSAYLSVPGFVVRAAIYFALWIGISRLLSRWSKRQDQTADPRLTRSARLLSAPGLIAYVLTATFASIDWVMSLDPRWYSSIYGMVFVVGQALSSLALAIIAISLLARYSPFDGILTRRHFHHLGNMLLAFTMLWAYMAFSQLIIIWSGNLPDENFWYINRLGRGWKFVAAFLIVGHFFVPFLVLLSRRAKQSARSLTLIASLLLVMRVVDDYWLIVPSFHPGAVHIHWLDISVLVAIGGFWLAAFLRHLKQNSLVPLHDPRFTAVVRDVKG
jgi:hypothetical protein